jgi:predicted RNase H-like HicB family nuclease
MQLIEGQTYLDKTTGKKVVFAYMGKTGWAIVHPPGEPSMQDSYGVQPNDLEAILEPKKNTFYDDQLHYNIAGKRFLEEAERVAYKLIETWIDKGYNFCEVETIFIRAITFQSTMLKLELRANAESQPEVKTKEEIFDEAMEHKYPIEIHYVEEDEGDNYVLAFYPDFGCSACSAPGDTIAEAVELLEEVKKEVIGFMIEQELPIPEPSTHPFINTARNKNDQKEKAKP